MVKVSRWFGVLIILLSIGCSTDVDLYADYKDITVVYGLINPNDSVHYLKINRAFIQDGVTATDLASNSHNFNYGENDLVVTVEERDGNDGSWVNAYTLERVSNEIPKDDGVFDNSTNVLYKFNTNGVNSNNLYKLSIYNQVLDKYITAETDIVKELKVNTPRTTSSTFEFKNSFNFLNSTVSITPQENISRVRASLFFNYTEVYNNGATSKDKSVELVLGEKKTSAPDGRETLDFEIIGATLFDKIKQQVDPNTPFLSHRVLANVSLKFILAGPELDTYMDVNAPSNTISQTKPVYTNINNGIGLFSSRGEYWWISSINTNATSAINIRNATISQLSQLGLGFCFGTEGIGFPVAPCQ